MPASPSVSCAIFARRQVLEISPGQVPSLREEPQITSTRERVAGSFCALLRGDQLVARRAPLHRELVVRDRAKPAAGLRGARRLAVLLVALPGDRLEALDRVVLLLEGRVVEVALEALAELLARHRPRRAGCGPRLQVVI